MKIVKVRSPFIIEVPSQGSTHTGSRVVLTIWNKDETEPTLGQPGAYILTKSNPSTTQKDTSYNIANYVREFIDNIKPTYNDYPSSEQNNEWVFFRVMKYWFDNTDYNLISNVLYYGVNGFTNYTNGNQTAIDTKLLLLGNTNINNYYWKDPAGYVDRKMEYVNLLLEKDTTTTTISAKYERIDDIAYPSIQNILVGQSGVFNYKIPISLIIVDGNFINGCKVTITLTPVTGSPTVYIFYTYPIEECKYTIVRCSFINRYGGWQTITFFKQQTNTIAVKGTDYKLTQSAINYNTSIGQFKTFNTNGKQTVKLNTGFVDENYSELITDLLLSETVLLDGKPVTVKTQGSDLKTSLKDRLINYEMDFEYAYNLINDVV
jgi:hypothetical protein